MTQYVVIEKDGVEAEVVKEAADDVWVPVMGWTIKGEPTDAPTRDPFAPAAQAESTAQSTAGGTSPKAEDGVQAPAESS
jgi:hypothetical protein